MHTEGRTDHREKNSGDNEKRVIKGCAFQG